MAFATIAAIGGLALGGLGLYNQVQGSRAAQSAAKQQAQVAGEQSALSAEFASLEQAINVRNSQATYEGAAQSQAINKNIFNLDRSVEAQRFQAMELDANRKQLEVIRNQQRARSLALTTSTAQGSSRGSALSGAYGQISGSTGYNLAGIQQNLDIGRNIFGLNSQITDQRLNYSDLVTNLAKQQADLQTEKSNLISQYAQRGANLQTLYASYGSQVATGQAQASMGGNFINAGQSLFNAGVTFDRITGLGVSQAPGQPTSLAAPYPYTGTAYNTLPTGTNMGLRGLV